MSSPHRHIRRACAKSDRPLSPCPLSHKGRGGIPHQKAIWLPSPRVGEGLGVGGGRYSADFAHALGISDLINPQPVAHAWLSDKVGWSSRVSF